MGKHISEVIYVDNKALFPISWLHKQEYCEYQIYLENMLGVRVAPTQEMIEGKQEHQNLYDQFEKEAVPATLEDMLLESKKVTVFSRELRVRDTRHGIYGLIDEVLLTPREFIVIDDKPGTRLFLSNIHQVFGYCVAFREEIGTIDTRPTVAALRERGTDNIYWYTPFDGPAEEEILDVIERVHSLISGSMPFRSTENPNKCRACRLQDKCRRAGHTADSPGGTI
jgi:CRISPR/Cas system-associated exonuclease Cas4 (RecB family)